MPFSAPYDPNRNAGKWLAELRQITAPKLKGPVSNFQEFQKLEADALADLSYYVALHPDSHTIPHRIEQKLHEADLMHQIIQFRIRDKDHAAQVKQVRARIEADLIPAAARRKHHERLAGMIKMQVQPLGLDSRMPGIVQKLENCRVSGGKVGIDAAGDIHYHWPEKCRFSKMCPDEARIEGQRLAGRFIPAMLTTLTDKPGSKVQKMVISPANVPAGELAEFKRRIGKIYTELHRRKEFRIARKGMPGPILGSHVVQEDPLGRDLDSWNVHLNVIQIVDGHFNWKRYRQAWIDALGAESCQFDFKTEAQMRAITKARLAKRGIHTPVGRQEILVYAFLECVKYTSKIAGSDHQNSSLETSAECRGDTASTNTGASDSLSEALPMDQWPPLRWLEWYQANCGFRRSRSYGCLYNIPEPTEEQPDVNYIAVVSWDFHEEKYRVYIDLIPADKFSENTQQKSLNTLHPRGPP